MLISETANLPWIALSRKTRNFIASETRIIGDNLHEFSSEEQESSSVFGNIKNPTRKNFPFSGLLKTQEMINVI